MVNWDPNPLIEQDIDSLMEMFNSIKAALEQINGGEE